MTEEIKTTVEEKVEEKKPSPKKKVDIKKWKNRKLKFVNDMANKAKADAIAKRVLRNK